MVTRCEIIEDALAEITTAIIRIQQSVAELEGQLKYYKRSYKTREPKPKNTGWGRSYGYDKPSPLIGESK